MPGRADGIAMAGMSTVTSDPKVLRNRTFDELRVGDTASLSHAVGSADIALFAAASGDVNPSHLDPRFAASDPCGHIVAHGMWSAALVSAVIGTELPGPGTTVLAQDLHFRKPVVPGDTITATVSVARKHDTKHLVELGTRCLNQHGEEVLAGTATVIAPREHVEWPRMPAPEVSLRRHDRYAHILRDAAALGALPVAIVHPCSIEALGAALEARDEGLLEPLLVGPEAKIRAIAEQGGLSLAGIGIESTEHSHGAAARAVELALQGRVAALMKGSLHTDELLGAIVAPGSGLHTERRISHVYAMDVPRYPKPLILTDAAINIAPTLAHKRDICQNAIDLLHVMGVPMPRVAVLAAVEVVNPAMPATLDAAALTVMAMRGQITGAQVDGPLAFDNAISLDAARTKEIVSPVAGSADILLVPDLEAGNMLAKQLIYLADADAAGLVLGVRVPVILTSRADSLQVRLASVALARLVVARSGAAQVPA
jgi:phosphate acetyltransferase